MGRLVVLSLSVSRAQAAKQRVAPALHRPGAHLLFSPTQTCLLRLFSLGHSRRPALDPTCAATQPIATVTPALDIITRLGRPAPSVPASIHHPRAALPCHSRTPHSSTLSTQHVVHVFQGRHLSLRHDTARKLSSSLLLPISNVHRSKQATQLDLQRLVATYTAPLPAHQSDSHRLSSACLTLPSA